MASTTETLPPPPDGGSSKVGELTAVPSTDTVKSAAPRPVTGAPDEFVTLTHTWMGSATGCASTRKVTSAVASKDQSAQASVATTDALRRSDIVLTSM